MLDVCDPRVIRALLEKYGFHFSKAKGQNFLTQRWVPQRIAQEAGIDRSTGVLEIGPGFGPLTQELCLRAGRVTAIELDTTLRPVLAETVGEFDNLTIHFADAMKMDLPALVQAEFPGLTPAACANLPYYITSPVLTRLLESRCFSAVTVMVQKEAAQRVAEGQLSVRQTEALVKALQKERNEKPKAVGPDLSLYLGDLEKDLSGRLGRKVKIAHKGKKGRIELEYYDDQDLEALLTLLQSLHREGGGGNG